MPKQEWTSGFHYIAYQAEPLTFGKPMDYIKPNLVEVSHENIHYFLKKNML